MDLAIIVRNTCQRKARGAGEPRFTMTTIPNAKQKQVVKLLDTIVVQTEHCTTIPDLLPIPNRDSAISASETSG